MNGQKKILLWGGILMLLVAVYIVLLVKPTGQEQGTDSLASTVIFQTETENITAITITNSCGEISFYRKDGSWLLKDREAVELLQANVTSLSYDFVNLNAIRVIDTNPSELSQFGLDVPSAVAKITLADSSTVEFLLGDQAQGGNGYYFKRMDEPAVYTISSVVAGNLLHDLAYYRDKALIPMEADQITGLELYSREGQAVVVKNESGDSYQAWQMTEPYQKDVYQQSWTEEILTPLSELSVSEFYDDAPKSLGAYGLDAPMYTLTVSGAEETVHILVGNEENGSFYVKREDKPYVCKITTDSLTFLTGLNPFDYIDKYPYLPQINSVNAISAQFGDRALSMELQRSGGDTKYLINQKESEASVFKDLYQALFTATIIGAAENSLSNEPLLSYTVEKTDGSQDTVLYLPMDERNCAVSINGEIDFYVTRKDVTRIIESLEKAGE